MKKVFEPVSKSLEKTSQDITKTITETSVEKKQTSNREYKQQTSGNIKRSRYTSHLSDVSSI